MKAWMKALVWVGLGGGIGFFGGYRVGYSKCVSDMEQEIEDLRDRTDRLSAMIETMRRENAPTPDKMADISERMGRLHEIPDMEASTDVIADRVHQILESYAGKTDEDDVPEMPMEEPVIDDPLAEDPEEEDDSDEEIPDLHPEDLVPHPINEDEFNLNPKGYDISILHYYRAEDIVHDPEYDEEMTQDEQLLGIGWFALFGRDPKEGATIYIENDTMETIYAVHYHNGSIEDA